MWQLEGEVEGRLVGVGQVAANDLARLQCCRVSMCFIALHVLLTVLIG